MPTARIEIEQTHAGWIAEIAAGGVMARCRTLRADRFDSILHAITEAYREMTGAPPADATRAPATPPAPTPEPPPAPAPEATPPHNRLTLAGRARGQVVM